MCPADDANPKAISELAKLRGEIEECERFISICDRIKHLEQLEEHNSLLLKKHKVEKQRADTLQQIQSVSNDLQRYEHTLYSVERPMGACEQEELKVSIRSAKTRLRSLEIFADDTMAKIKHIEEEATNNAKLLQELYEQLERLMASGEFHPNTIRAKLHELKQRRELISAAKKANISNRSVGQRTDATGDRENMPVPDGAPVEEDKFFKALISDLQNAKKSVDIVSIDLCSQRAGEIMPILAKLVTAGRAVTIYTQPPHELPDSSQQESQSIISVAHRMRLTVMQQSNIPISAAIIDRYICWEGGISILGASQPGKTMRRIVGGIKARELRQFIFQRQGPSSPSTPRRSF